MGIFENEFYDDHSNFDDRIEEENESLEEELEESEPEKEGDLYYRHIEEY